VPEPSEKPSEPTVPSPASAEGGQTSPDSPGGESTENLAGPLADPDIGEPTASLGLDRTEVQSSPSREEASPGEPTTDLPSNEATTDFGHDWPDPQPRTKIRYLGDYELLEVLGKGGMGVVYRARQLTLNRMVAVKLIRPDREFGSTDLRRFQLEAEVIAALDHPGIVPIHEIGEHEGRHYFSMKLIAGESLQGANPKLRRDYPAIARIVAAAARAVQHAHERGVLHRDLKPSNILLDPAGVPHVCDFGLAKRFSTDAGEMTQSDGIVGSPGYMAPEQATATRGAITTATDVYGLGAVLYAMLSGHAPHRGSSVLEVLDAVRERHPEPPRKEDPTIPRDLEVICMRCLEREPGRRYRSAGEFADDLERWSEGRPINARKVSAPARVLMWCKRKPLVAGLAGALLITAVLGSTGVLVNWLEVRRQRDKLTQANGDLATRNTELARANVQIREEWDTSRSLNDFLVNDLLGHSTPFVSGRRDVSVSVLLDRSSALVTSRFARRPKIEGSIRQILGHAYLSLGMQPKAEVEFLQSYTLRQSLPEEDELDRLSAEVALATLRVNQGRFDEAERHARKAYDGRKQRLGEVDEATLEAATLLGAVLKLKGRVEEARKLLEDVARLAQNSLGGEHEVTLRARLFLAVIAHDLERYEEASTNLEELVGIFAKVSGEDYPQTLMARSLLGISLLGLKQEARAEEILAAILVPAREVFGPEDPQTLRIQAKLAVAQASRGKLHEAERNIAGALKNPQPSDHPEFLSNETNRAIILLNQGKIAEGEALLRGLEPGMRRRFGPDRPELINFMISRANALERLKKPTEAEALNTEALGILSKTVAADHPLRANAEALQAALLLANGKPAEAEPLARRVLELRSKPGAKTPPSRLGAIQRILGGSLAGQKKYAEAEPFLLGGMKLLESDPTSSPSYLIDCRDRLIQLYDAWGKPEEAAKWRAHRLPGPGL
jgi:eukaryotic-like serine/threonine-protein kinase